MLSFEEIFADIEKNHQSLQQSDLVKTVNETNSSVIVFGAGAIGHAVAKDIIIDLPQRLIAFCDNNKGGTDHQFGVPIISPETMLKEHKNAVIIIAINYEFSDLIYDQVLSLGFSKDKVFRRYSGYERISIEEFKKNHYDCYRWAYDFFDDEISKRVVVDKLKCCLYFHEPDNSVCKDQYFDTDVFALSKTEVFVDCGAYIGDSALEFMSRVGGKYERIYSFEPDNETYMTMRENLHNYKNTTQINKGVWDEECTLRFSAVNSGSSHIKSSSEVTDTIEITTISLDDFFQNEPHIPTFIKMDIEGAEKKALLGTQNIIRTYRPKLAICVYHKIEDVYELTELINSMNGYNFRLRHYSKGASETVLYAF